MISEPKAKMLLLLLNAGPLRFTDIVDGLSRSKKRVADHINGLEAIGCIIKQSDGRYCLTDKGLMELAKFDEIKKVCQKYDAMMEEIKPKEGETK